MTRIGKSWCKRDSNPGPSALEADALTTWPTRRPGAVEKTDVKAPLDTEKAVGVNAALKESNSKMLLLLSFLLLLLLLFFFFFFVSCLTFQEHTGVSWRRTGRDNVWVPPH